MIKFLELFFLAALTLHENQIGEFPTEEERLMSRSLPGLESKVRRRREEMYRIFLHNGRSPEKAEQEDQIVASDLMLSSFEILKKSHISQEIVSHSRNILLLDTAFQDNARKKLPTQLLEDLRVALFDRHIISRDPGKGDFPTNLVDPSKGNRYLTTEELKKRMKQGEDLSLLDPPNSSFWHKPLPLATSRSVQDFQFPRESAYTFLELVKSGHSPKIRIEKEVMLGGEKVRKWRCKFDEEVNVELVTSRILKRMGYHADNFYYSSRPKVYFKNENQRARLKRDWLAFYQNTARWKRLVAEVGRDDQGPFIIFHEASCRPGSPREKRVGAFHLNLPGNSSRRELRGHLLVQAFFGGADIKEEHNNKTKIVNGEILTLVSDVGNGFGHTIFPNNPNNFSHILIHPQFQRPSSPTIPLKYRRYHFIGLGNPFRKAQYHDLKWMARYLAQITPEELKSLVAAGHWPPPLERLYLEKLSHRRNDLVAAFDLEKEGYALWKTKIPWPAPSLSAYHEGKHIQGGRVLSNFRDPDNYYPTDYLKTLHDLYRNNRPTFRRRGRSLQITAEKGEDGRRFLELKIEWMSKDTSAEKLEEVVGLVNTMSNDPEYIRLTPSLYGNRRYGDIYLTFQLKFPSHLSIQNFERQVVSGGLRKEALAIQKFIRRLKAPNSNSYKILARLEGEYLPPDGLIQRETHESPPALPHPASLPVFGSPSSSGK